MFDGSISDGLYWGGKVSRLGGSSRRSRVPPIAWISRGGGRISRAFAGA